MRKVARRASGEGERAEAAVDARGARGVEGRHLALLDGVVDVRLELARLLHRRGPALGRLEQRFELREVVGGGPRGRARALGDAVRVRAGHGGLGAGDAARRVRRRPPRLQQLGHHGPVAEGARRVRARARPLPEQVRRELLALARQQPLHRRVGRLSLARARRREREARALLVEAHLEHGRQRRVVDVRGQRDEQIVVVLGRGLRRRRRRRVGREDGHDVDLDQARQRLRALGAAVAAPVVAERRRRLGEPHLGQRVLAVDGVLGDVRVRDALAVGRDEQAHGHGLPQHAERAVGQRHERPGLGHARLREGRLHGVVVRAVGRHEHAEDLGAVGDDLVVELAARRVAGERLALQRVDGGLGRLGLARVAGLERGRELGPRPHVDDGERRVVAQRVHVEVEHVEAAARRERRRVEFHGIQAQRLRARAAAPAAHAAARLRVAHAQPQRRRGRS
mmetsp:Transcript_36675/g.124154  ORF Transcript_36675/g.124154 Transcript_36675/m.124154 type:complete len:453 (-) Transcript_36675:514-1872(-)